MLVIYAVLAVTAALLCWGTERVDRPKRRALREASARTDPAALAPAE